MTKKTCERCGKPYDSFSWEFSDMCYSCRKEKNLEDIKDNILSGEIDCTDCEDEVICPWCGPVIESDCESREFYEDGTHVMECPECEKEFTLSTSVSYSYSTERELPRYVLRDREEQRKALAKIQGGNGNE